MCVIVDVNVAARVLLRPDDPDFAPVSLRLIGKSKRALILVYGGRLLDEYKRHRALIRLLAVLDRNGRAVQRSAIEIDVAERKLQHDGNCVSNDLHILALAVISGTRLLVSHDHDLHQDFKNPKILSNPRGRIYQNRNHLPILQRTNCSH
jgi:predicted nucleic acid-binding protein